MFEDSLIDKLRELDSVNTQLKILEDQKSAIREQIQKWREINEIKNKVVITEGDSSWIIDVYDQIRRSVVDFDVLINKLGDDAPVFIKNSTSSVLKITKR